MTIDKFGHHLKAGLQKYFVHFSLTCHSDPSGTGNYYFPNNKTMFLIPIDGEINSIDIHPKDTQFLINAEDIASPIGYKLRKGDRIAFIAANKSSETLWVNLTLKCSTEW